MALPPGMTQEKYDALLEKIDILQDAIDTGVQECYYGDKRVTYRSLNEMKRILNDMLTKAGLKKPTDGRSYAVFGDGFGKKGGCSTEGGEHHW